MTRLSPLVETSGAVMRVGAKMVAAPYRMSASGTANVSEDGPLILAARHYHHLLDGVGLLAQVNRPLHILIALDWATSRATRWLMEGLASACAWPVTLRGDAFQPGVPASEGRVRSAYTHAELQTYQRHSYRECLDLLRADRAVVVFPEGFPAIDPHTVRPRPSGGLAPFKPGFARLAVAAARRDKRPVPVLPVGIRPGADKPSRLTFVYGEARPVSATTDVTALTAEIRDDVAMLSA